MTDNHQEKEDERIAKWRAERAEAAEEARKERIKIAEQEKQERIKKAKQEREDELKRQQEAELAEAKELLPDAETIEKARHVIQARDRRRTRIVAVLFFFWVILPTALVGYYTSQIAVPLFEARSVVVVSKALNDGDESLGGLLGVAASQNTLREVFMAHEYVQSQALMDELEAELGLVSEYSGELIDPLQRLRDIPLIGISRRSSFDRFVTSSINVQTGLMHLYVRAPSPEDAVDHSNAVLGLISEQINSLSEELFAARIEQAQRAVSDAEVNLQRAQTDLTLLQIESGEVDPRARIEGVFEIISQIQSELLELRTEIDRAVISGQTAARGTERLTELEELLNERIAEQRALMVGSGPNGEKSLNLLLMDYEQALLRARIGQEALAVALAGLSDVRERAVLGRSKFQVVVPPKTSQSPKFPNPLSSILITFISLASLFSMYRLLFARSRD